MSLLLKRHIAIRQLRLDRSALDYLPLLYVPHVRPPPLGFDAAARKKGNDAQTRNADEFARLMIPIITEIKQTGRSDRQTAIILNDRGYRTARRSDWSGTQVGLVRARARTRSLTD